MNYRLVNQPPIPLSPFIHNECLPKIKLQIKNFSLSLDEINSLYNNMLDPLKRASLLNHPIKPKISMKSTRSRFYRSMSSNLYPNVSNKSSIPITKSTFHYSIEKSIRNGNKTNINDSYLLDNNNKSIIQNESNKDLNEKNNVKYPSYLDVIKKRIICKGSNNSRNQLQNSKSAFFQMKKYIDREKRRARNLRYYFKKEEESKIEKIIANQYDSTNQRYSFFPSV